IFGQLGLSFLFDRCGARVNMTDDAAMVVVFHIAGDLTKCGFDPFTVGDNHSLSDKGGKQECDGGNEGIEQLLPSSSGPSRADGENDRDAEGDDGERAFEEPGHGESEVRSQKSELEVAVEWRRQKMNQAMGMRAARTKTRGHNGIMVSSGVDSGTLGD